MEQVEVELVEVLADKAVEQVLLVKEIMVVVDRIVIQLPVEAVVEVEDLLVLEQ